jgi:hypothetical protein
MNGPNNATKWGNPTQGDTVDIESAVYLLSKLSFYYID